MIDFLGGMLYFNNENHFHFIGCYGMMRKGNRWGQKLKDCGFRLTVARQAIIDVLENTESHLSAEDIYMAVYHDNPGIGLTTVYRTLDLLEQNGIVSKFDFGHGRARYELSEQYGKKEHHHHLICKKCGRITDYADFQENELQYIRMAERGLEEKYSYRIDGHNIQFYGECPDCKSG